MKAEAGKALCLDRVSVCLNNADASHDRQSPLPPRFSQRVQRQNQPTSACAGEQCGFAPRFSIAARLLGQYEQKQPMVDWVGHGACVSSRRGLDTMSVRIAAMLAFASASYLDRCGMCQGKHSVDNDERHCFFWSSCWNPIQLIAARLNCDFEFCRIGDS